MEERQRVIERLQEELQAGARQGAGGYIEFLEARLKETQEESRRMLAKYGEARQLAYAAMEGKGRGAEALRQVMERERKQAELEGQRRAKALEEAQARVRKAEEEAGRLRTRVRELEEELVEREACEAKVQEYVKALLKER